MTAVHATEPSSHDASDWPLERPTYAAATRALDAVGVTWVRLRPRHGDAEDDLLVDPAGWDHARTALARIGFVFIPSLGRGSHRAFHAFDPETGAWLKLDLVTRIDFGRFMDVPTDLATGFLARRRPDGHDWLLDSDDLFWSVLFHELLDKWSPRGARLAELAALAAHARTTGPGAELAASSLSSGAAPERLIAWAAAGDIDALRRAGHQLRRRRRRRIGRTLRRLRNGTLRRLDRVEPLFVRRGLSIAVLGRDGSARSTLSWAVAAGGPLPLRTVDLGLDGGSRGLGGIRRVPGLESLARLIRMWRGWTVGRLHVARGRIVILDRHPYDARLREAAGRRHPIGWRILAGTFPAPDLVAILDAPAELLQAPGPGDPVERPAAQRGGLALASTLRRAEVVDVSAPAEGVARTLTALAWGRLAERAYGPAER